MLPHRLQVSQTAPGPVDLTLPGTAATISSVTRRARRLAIGAWAAGTIAAGAAGGAVFFRLTAPTAVARAADALHGNAVWPGGHATPGFSLTDQNGHRFSLASQRGRIVIVTFLDSHCTQLCPIEAQELRAVDDRLRPSQRPVIVAISINPQDTPASVRRFAKRARWSGPWYWLMGSQRTLAPVWRAFGIEVVTLHEKINGVTVTSIGHSTAVYLLDRRGHERAGYSVPVLPARVAEDVRTLERPA